MKKKRKKETMSQQELIELTTQELQKSDDRCKQFGTYTCATAITPGNRIKSHFNEQKRAFLVLRKKTMRALAKYYSKR